MMIFPNGLKQPPGSARFALDTLLLASFASRSLHAVTGQDCALAMEPGCGCGAALLGVALLCSATRCVGFDREDTLVEAAIENAVKMGLESRCIFFQAEVDAGRNLFKEYEGKADIVLVNPPWKNPAAGRITARPLRRKAFWAHEDTLYGFLKGSSSFLKHHGRLCMIFPPGLLPEFFNVLKSSGLGLRQILPVTPFASKPAHRLLVLCQKNAATDFKLMPPLAVHVAGEGLVHYTEEAMNFCPWLSRTKNASPFGQSHSETSPELDGLFHKNNFV